jgi:hypothetical protein
MDAPQFQTAEYAGFQGKDVCKKCGQPAGDPYYRVGGNMVCASCAEKARLALPVDQHSAFFRAVLFGVGGAIVGLAAYATFAIVTGVVIGFAALAVGYIVAKAMMAGSRGVGGRRYQIAAALLTYFAVSMSVIPISIAQYIQHHQKNAQSQSQQTSAENNDLASHSGDTSGASANGKNINIGAAVVSLLFVGIAAPFLELRDPIHGGIGLVILYVGIQIAWKMAKGTASAGDIAGPFRNPTPAAPPALG